MRRQVLNEAAIQTLLRLDEGAIPVLIKVFRRYFGAVTVLLRLPLFDECRGTGQACAQPHVAQGRPAHVLSAAASLLKALLRRS